MEEKYYYCQWSSPVGTLHLLSDKISLLQLTFDARDPQLKTRLTKAAYSKNNVLKKTVLQLEEYFQGKRKNFDLPVSLQGTEFQKKVWNALMSIPYGKTVSYKDQAAKIKKPRAMRAVGTANGKNPIAIIIPCHRVIAHNGSLGGYGGGLKLKSALLALEKTN